MTPEVSQIMQDQLRWFREKFGREPGSGDPVFFDPDADVLKPISEDWLREQTVAAMDRLPDVAAARPTPPQAALRTQADTASGVFKL